MVWKKVKKGAKQIGKSCEKAAKYVYKKAKKALSGKNVQRLVIGSVVIIGTGLVVSATGGAGLAVSGQILKISLACGAAEGAYQGLKYRIKHGKKYGKIRKKAFDGFTTGYATGAIIFSVFPNVKSSKGSKFKDIFDLADNYNLSNDTFNNHILNRHGPNSLYGNKSHFNGDFDIKNGIDSTLKGDNFIIKSNTAGRDGYIFEQTFTNPIGTNNKGKPLYTIKVVIDEFGNVVTAFPKK